MFEILRWENISTSKIKCFQVDVWAKTSKASVEAANSNPRDLALPICGAVLPDVDCSVPRTAVAVSYKLIVLNASESPETKLTSGVPYTLST